MLMEIVVVTYVTFVSIILLLLVWAVNIINKKAERPSKNKGRAHILSIKQACAAPKHGRKRAISGNKAQTKRHLLTSN